jgi:hypothetical protein
MTSFVVSSVDPSTFEMVASSDVAVPYTLDS